jgi:hypothetical protein
MAGTPAEQDPVTSPAARELPPNVRIVTARAIVQPMSGDERLSKAQEVRAASWMPMVTDGEPTKLMVTAWLAHEGRNNNGQSFRAEDLAAAAAKIASPNLLPMDWNHGAVLPWSEDPKAIGVWYSAEAKQDPDAKNGEGALGIEAKGIVWAWAFQEQAQEMLAMQAARGYCEFSMACIPKSVELHIDDSGYNEVMIEPVFFTLSALNVPPADPDAKGAVEMSGEEEEIAAAQSYDLATASLQYDLEATVASEMAARAGSTTDFPTHGDTMAVGLKTSQWAVFPVAEAQALRTEYPEIWQMAGNVRGNEQFRRLAPVAQRGGAVKTATEEFAVRVREAWVARHHEDSHLPGVVAQVKWLAVGSQGIEHMRSVLSEAKALVTARRAQRTKEAGVDNTETQTAALEVTLEANEQLRAQIETANAAVEQATMAQANAEAALAAATARADEASLRGEALQAELALATEQLTAVTAQLETATAQLAEIAAAQEAQERTARWASRFDALPETYRTAFARRTVEEQERFTSRWSVASDEDWAEFTGDLLVGFTDVKLSYLQLTKDEGKLPVGTDGAADLGARVAALRS